LKFLSTTKAPRGGHTKDHKGHKEILKIEKRNDYLFVAPNKTEKKGHKEDPAFGRKLQ
jgi:hypothetical protein